MSWLKGITQGRLIKPWNGELQCFPQHDWEQEFSFANQVGLDYVELLIEREYNPANPIWSDWGLNSISDAAKNAGLKLYSAVNDYVINYDLVSSPVALKQTIELIDRLRRLGVQKLVVPLFEASEITGRSFADFRQPLREIADVASDGDIEIFLETTLPAVKLLDLLGLIDRLNVAACFDTGNRAALGQNIYDDILTLRDSLRHVHVKDKNSSNQNVFLGSGVVDFSRVCQCLCEIAYSEAFTFEALRGTDPLRTARFHLEFLEFFLEEACAGRVRAQVRPSAN